LPGRLGCRAVDFDDRRPVKLVGLTAAWVIAAVVDKTIRDRDGMRGFFVSLNENTYFNRIKR
jgi:hypothetical protein